MDDFFKPHSFKTSGFYSIRDLEEKEEIMPAIIGNYLDDLIDFSDEPGVYKLTMSVTKVEMPAVSENQPVKDSEKILDALRFNIKTLNTVLDLSKNKKSLEELKLISAQIEILEGVLNEITEEIIK